LERVKKLVFVGKPTASNRMGARSWAILSAAIIFVLTAAAIFSGNGGGLHWQRAAQSEPAH
jgi:hypothetical protein